MPADSSGAQWPRYLVVYHYYTIAMGLTTQHSNTGRLKCIQPRLLAIYARCVNAALIVGMLFAFRARLALSADSYGGGNGLLHLTGLISLAVQFSMTLLTLLMRFRRQRHYMLIMSRLRTLAGHAMLNRRLCDVALERRFSRLMLAKFSVSCARLATTILLPLQLNKKLSVQSVLLLIYFANMQTLLPAIVFRYYSALLRACKYYALLNGQLRGLLISAMDTPIAERTLQDFAAVHWELSSLVQLLSDEFKYQMIATLLTYLTHNIYYSFYAALLIEGSIQTRLGGHAAVAVVLGGIACGVLYVDIYLFYWVCEMTTRSYAETRGILQEFQAEGGHAHCKEVEWLSLQLAQRDLHISMGGMFNMNMPALLNLFAYSLQNTLIWVQFDHGYYRQPMNT